MRFITSDEKEDFRPPLWHERYASLNGVRGTDDPPVDPRLILHPIPDDAVVVSRKHLDALLDYATKAAERWGPDVSEAVEVIENDIASQLGPAPDAAPNAEPECRCRPFSDGPWCSARPPQGFFGPLGYSPFCTRAKDDPHNDGEHVYCTTQPKEHNVNRWPVEKPKAEPDPQDDATPKAPDHHDVAKELMDEALTGGHDELHQRWLLRIRDDVLRITGSGR